MTKLVELLIEHRGELFEEEEVPGLAGTSPEELPALEAGTVEVCEGHREHDNQSLSPQKVGVLPQGRHKQGHPPACSSAKGLQSKADAGCPLHLVH